MRFSTTPALLVSLILTLLACSGEPEPTASAAATAPARVEVITVPARDVTAYTDYPARLRGVVNSEVRAKIAGYITDVLVDEGDRVRSGQVLFRLETQTLNQDAAAARANVNAAQVEVNKLKPLVEKNIISEVQLETANARLQQAQSGLESIQANIAYGRITSPIDGYIGRISLREGALVSPGSAEPITTVSDISEVYAYFSVNERQYIDYMQATPGGTADEKIANLPRVQLVLSNGTLYDEEGTIEAVISQVNSQTGTVQIRAIFDNPARLLNEGQSGRIRVPQEFTDVAVVPQTATFDRQGTTYVYKVDDAGKLTAVPLTITTDVDNLFIVSEGVEAGDRIAVTGLGQLRGGAQVNPVETSFDSIAQPVPTVFR